MDKMEQKPTIIYIHMHLFTPYMSRLFCNDRLVELGGKVFVWDVSRLIGMKKTKNQFKYDNFEIKDIKNKKHLYLLIKKYRHSVFVMSINPEKRFFWIYFYLAFFNCKHIKILNGLTASYGAAKFQLIANIRSYIKKTLLFWLNKIHIFSAPSTIFLPGYFWNKIIIGSPQIVKVNHFLYDDFLTSQFNTNSIPVQCQNYILFLDEYHPLHPDWETTNFKNIIPPNKYFASMKKAFDYFEKKFNLPVIVAAHPKASYSGCEFGEGIFGKRKIIQNKTDELSYGAQIFLAHASTSRFLAVFQKKPLYHIFLNAFYHYPIAMQNAYQFAKDIQMPISYEENNFAIENTPVNLEIYQNVLYKFCSSKETYDIITYPIIAEQIFSIARKQCESSSDLY